MALNVIKLDLVFPIFSYWQSLIIKLVEMNNMLRRPSRNANIFNGPIVSEYDIPMYAILQKNAEDRTTVELNRLL